MSPKHWDVSCPNDGKDAGEAFELLEQCDNSPKSTSQPTTDDDGATSNFAKLPPRTVALQSTTHVVRKAFWTGLFLTIIIVGLSCLTAFLNLFVPDTGYFTINDRVSCDLTTERGGTFQSAFTINLRGAAHLTFTEAKAIDVVWQLFVGAGGRFAMAWISYKVFVDGLTRLAEQSPVSYDLYTSLTFATTSLFAVWSSIKAVFYSKGWRIKCFLIWFGLSTIYVLGFPTLIGATAGYLTPSTVVFKLPNGISIRPDSPNLTSCYNVSAGALIGYTNQTIAEGPPVSEFDILNEGITSCPFISLHGFCDSSSDLWREYPLFASLINSTLNYSTPVYDANDTASYAKNGSLGKSPAIALAYGRDAIVQNYTSNITIEGRLFHFRNFEFRPGPAYEPSYCYQNTTIQDLGDLAQCFPEHYFVWGFSSLLVYINLFLFMFWLFGMYIVWLDATIYSALCRSGRKIGGPYRAVADLSEAMKEVLGNDTCAYSDSDLARKLSKQPGLRYYASDSQDGEVSHIGLSSASRSRVPYNSTKLYGNREKD